jgi:hypothetical protein
VKLWLNANIVETNTTRHLKSGAGGKRTFSIASSAQFRRWRPNVIIAVAKLSATALRTAAEYFAVPIAPGRAAKAAFAIVFEPTESINAGLDQEFLLTYHDTGHFHTSL